MCNIAHVLLIASHRNIWRAVGKMLYNISAGLGDSLVNTTFQFVKVDENHHHDVWLAVSKTLHNMFTGLQHPLVNTTFQIFKMDENFPQDLFH